MPWTAVPKFRWRRGRVFQGKRTPAYPSLPQPLRRAGSCSGRCRFKSGPRLVWATEPRASACRPTVSLQAPPHGGWSRAWKAASQGPPARVPRTEAAHVAVMHGQAMSHSLVPTSTELRPHGEIGDKLDPTPEGSAQGRAAGGRRGLLGGVSRGNWGTGEPIPSVRPSGTAARCCDRGMVPGAPGHPRGGEDGLTGGPGGPGGPGVCEEQVQAEAKAGQVSPSFWEKGDPTH